MGLFDRKKPAELPVVQTEKHEPFPFHELNGYTPLKHQARLYKMLREAVPVIDAAIGKIIRLTGTFSVDCEDEELKRGLNEFLKNVGVGGVSKGIDAFIGSFLDQLLTYGTAVGEIVPNVNRDGIYALYVASHDDVELRRGANPLAVEVCRHDGVELIPVKFRDLILVSALNPEPGEVTGTSLLKGLPFVSSVLLKIFHTVGLNWERVGNVRFAVTYKPSNDASEKAYTKERVMQIAKEWSNAMRSSADGRVSDFVSVGDVSIRVIGADNQIIDSEIPVKQMLEQIVAKTGIPPFLLGLNWSTTERMSKQQCDILTSELECYRRLLDPVIRRICSFWLSLNGRDDRFSVEWEDINLQDELDSARSRLIAAQAQKLEREEENA